MTMDAIVLQVNPGSLLVRDLSNNNEVLVNFRDSRRFSVGDNVRITYTGAMTFSIPPQITATSITRIPARPPQTVLSEMRGVVLMRRRNQLVVRDTSNNRQVIVNTQNANFFCVGQRILVRYDTMFIDNIPVINAIEIMPVC